MMVQGEIRVHNVGHVLPWGRLYNIGWCGGGRILGCGEERA